MCLPSQVKVNMIVRALLLVNSKIIEIRIESHVNPYLKKVTKVGHNNRLLVKVQSVVDLLIVYWLKFKML